MKTHNLRFIIPLGFIYIMLFSACEKNIEIEVPDPEEKIVVEGWIEPNQVANVMLTKNAAFFSVVDSTTLINMIVQNAIVKVSDGTTTEQLSMVIDPNYFPPILYRGSSLKGVVGKTYTLTIEADGKFLSAVTTIPIPIPLDSSWFQVEPGKDSLGYLWATITDPQSETNYYRLCAMRKGKDNRFIPILGSVYEDKFFNGQSLTFSMNRGFESFTTNVEDDEATYFKIGDTIILQSSTVDYTTFDFWRKAESEMFSSGNPFATPTSIPTNIVGGALGNWGGYGTSYDTIIAKP